MAWTANKKRPFDLLPTSEADIDVSPAALWNLKMSTLPDPADSPEVEAQKSAHRAILDAACTPPPLHPQLTRPLVEAWAMTSLTEHTGRPKIQPWLRGWVEEEAQTTLVWRKYLPLDRTPKRQTLPSQIAEFFDSAPIHLSEQLERPTRFDVIPWLKTRAEAIKNAHPSTATDDPKFAPLKVDEPFGILLDKAGEPITNPVLTIEKLLLLYDLQENKAAIERRLFNATLILDVRFGGLDNDGMLDAKIIKLPPALDDGCEWLQANDEPVIPYRVIESDNAVQANQDRRWRSILRQPTLRNEDDEPTRWLHVFNWCSAVTSADSAAIAPAEEFLAAHQEKVVNWVETISRKLDLPENYRNMLRIAASRHDEGKAATNWQNAFHAPVEGRPYAKTRGPIKQSLMGGYRHELGSLPALLADLEFKKLPEDLRDLALHLVAAHHGFARPLLDPKGAEEAPSLLESRVRDIALRFVRLQDRWGPWGLAWWESLLRAADQQASRGIEPETPTENLTSHG